MKVFRVEISRLVHEKGIAYIEAPSESELEDRLDEVLDILDTFGDDIFLWNDDPGIEPERGGAIILGEVEDFSPDRRPDLTYEEIKAGKAIED